MNIYNLEQLYHEHRLYHLLYPLKSKIIVLMLPSTIKSSKIYLHQEMFTKKMKIQKKKNQKVLKKKRKKVLKKKRQKN